MKYKLNDDLEKFASLVLNVDADEDEGECDEDDKESYEQWLNAFGHIHIVADGSFRTVKFKHPSGRETSIKLPCAREVVCDLRGDGIVFTDIRFNQTEADDLSRAFARCVASRLKRGLNDDN